MTDIEPFNKVFISWNLDRTFIINQNLVYKNISQQNLFTNELKNTCPYSQIDYLFKKSRI